MSDYHLPIHSRQLPATFRARYPWFIWPVMGVMALFALVLLWAALFGISRGWLTTNPKFAAGFVVMVLFGLGYMAFPLLFLWSAVRGLPLLQIDEGVVRHTSVFGRVQVFRLSDYAEASLGEAVLAKGYQPRVEFLPAVPDTEMRTLHLRPFVQTPAGAEALVALIREAAGDRPKPTRAQEAVRRGLIRKEWMILGAISIGAFILLILLDL